MRFGRVLAALAAGLAMAASSAGAEKMSAFGPGEQTSYSVSYLGMTAGSAQITVGSNTRQWGKDVWPIVTKAQTEALTNLYPVRDKFVTYFDPATQTTIGSDLFADEGRHKRRQRIKLDPAHGTAETTQQKEGADETVKTDEIQQGTLDMCAVAFAIRNKDLEIGREFDFPIYTGAKTFTLKATVEGKTMVATKFGEQEAYKVRVYTDFTGKLASKRDMFVYATTDERHLIVKVEAEFLIGTLSAEITDFQPGKQVALVGAAPSANGQGGSGR